MRRVMVGAVLALALATDVSAQIPGVNLNLFPRVGVFQPRSNLTEEGVEAKLRGGLAIGLSAEFTLPLLPDIRANLEYVPKVGTTQNDVDDDTENSLLALTADLVMSLAPPLSPIKPYLLVGGGVKRYEFDSSIGTSTKESDPTLHVGAGVGLKLGPLLLVGEASDYISRFEFDNTDSGKKLQNDIFFMVGFKIGMF